MASTTTPISTLAGLATMISEAETEAKNVQTANAADVAEIATLQAQITANPTAAQLAAANASIATLTASNAAQATSIANLQTSVNNMNTELSAIFSAANAFDQTLTSPVNGP